MIALLWTFLAAAPGLIFILAMYLASRKPAKVNTCGDASCEACALLSGKWPKYNPGPRQREGMSLRRAQKQLSAHHHEFDEAREGQHA